MAINCFKCGGRGKIEKFGHVANGDCFQCCGTGRLLTKAEKTAILAEQATNHDRRLAKEVGVSLDDFQAYVNGPVPTHPNGFSYSMEEFIASRRVAA